MDLGLTGKAVIVLASSAGIGKATALAFARENASVMLFARSGERLQQTCQEIFQATGKRAAYTVGDVTRPADIGNVVSRTRARFGPVYALVNNSGGPPAGSFDNFDDTAWQQAFELTLLSFIRSIREVVPLMKAAGGGRIVNCASSSTKQCLDNLILSNTFRMGVVGLTKTLARELGRHRILINTVGPGKIETDRLRQLDEMRASNMGIAVDELKQAATGEIPIGRYGDPQEFARLIVFLCSAANTYISGQNLLVDGGLIKAY